MAKRKVEGPADGVVTSELEQERDEAKVAYDAAEQAVSEAVTARDEAKARFANAQAALEPVPELGKHILVDIGSTGSYAVRDAPKEWTDAQGNFAHQRTHQIDGVSVEQVGVDAATGVRQYRKM